MAGEVLATTFIGPPVTDLRAGQWSLGACYAYSEHNVEVAGSDEFEDETVLEDAEIETRLARVGVGLITDRV